MPATSSLWSPNHSVQGRGRWGPPAAGRVGAAGSPPSPVRTCPGRPLGPRVLLAHSNSRKLRTPPGTGTSDRRASRRAAALPAHHAHDPRAGRRACRKLRRCEGSGCQGGVPRGGAVLRRAGARRPRARVPRLPSRLPGNCCGWSPVRDEGKSSPPGFCPAQTPCPVPQGTGACQDRRCSSGHLLLPSRAAVPRPGPRGPGIPGGLPGCSRRLLPPSGLTPWQGRLPEP